jgi:dTDP-glucose pyrophosphorylase
MPKAHKQTLIKELSIDANTSLLQAIKLMDKLDRKLLLVMQNSHYHSMVSLGDIQRAIIQSIPLESPVSSVLRQDVKVCTTLDSSEHIRAQVFKWRMEFLPILDEDEALHDVIFWHDLFEEEHALQGKLDLPVVIMAGGFGSRLKPITNIIPKPLIPLGEKPIIQVIVENFEKMGATQFFFSVNYKADMIQQYFEQFPQYNITYIVEDKPFGTAGSLALLRDKIDQTFFVSNCDIIVEQDLEEIYKYHKENKNELTLVAALKHYGIPYGTVEVKENGLLSALQEKPEITYMINAGLYILEPHLIGEIPTEEVFDITDLIANILGRDGRIGVYPVSEGSWFDIGEWKEYFKTLDDFDERTNRRTKRRTNRKPPPPP